MRCIFKMTNKKTYQKRLLTSLPLELYNQLEEVAKETKLSKSTIVRLSLQKELKSIKKSYTVKD